MLLHIPILLILVFLVATENDVTVTTNLGRITGRRKTLNYDMGSFKTVDSFLGVPYAQPPVGDLRFRNPEPATKWEGILDATKKPPKCPQPISCSGVENESCPSSKRLDIQEDCLYINIYTPYKAGRSKKFPVMVYIHGGSFLYGSGNDYNGEALASMGVVVVACNYRIGVLGFMSAGNQDMPGNYGIYDQVMVLTWVKENIEAFRGNPNQVTLFGHSAGGASIGIHLVSPLSKGLFHRAIIQSGPVNAHWAQPKPSSSYFPQVLQALAQRLGCSYSKVPTMVTCLRRIEWPDMASAYIEVPKFTATGTDLRPYIDGNLLPTNVTSLLKNGPINDVPVLIGSTKDEWSRFMTMFMNDTFDALSFEKGLDRKTFTRSLNYAFLSLFKWPKALIDVLLHEYTNWDTPNDPMANLNNYIELFTDNDFLAPSMQLARYLTDKDLPVYFYHFHHKLPMNLESKSGWEWIGDRSYHGIELSFLFGSPFSGLAVGDSAWYEGTFTDKDRKLCRNIMTMWTNFAKEGEPTSSNKNRDLINFEWKKFNPNTSDYLYIAADVTEMRQHLRSRQVAFWNTLIPNLTKKLESITQRTFEVEMWIIVGLSSLLLVIVVLLMITICKIRARIDRAWKNVPPKDNVKT